MCVQSCVDLAKSFSRCVNVYIVSVISMLEQSRVQKEKIFLHLPTQYRLVCYHLMFCVGSGCWCYCLNCYAFTVDTNVIITVVHLCSDLK